MNYASANLSFVLDAKLYICFEKHLSSLSNSERPAALDAQRRWLRERAREADAAAAGEAGGSLAPFE